MLEFEQIRRDIDSLPVEAQSLLVDFIQLLKKRYPLDLQEEKESKKQDWSDFIGSIEAETDLSRNYKTYLSNELNKKYDNH
jgi:hypothetical protein